MSGKTADIREKRKKARELSEEAHALRQEGRREESIKKMAIAIENMPEDKAYDKSGKAYMHYQAGLNYMYWRKLSEAESIDTMNADQLEGLAGLRKHWSEMMELVCELNYQEVSSHDVTPFGKNPILTNGIRAVMADGLFMGITKSKWFVWTRKFFSWPTGDDFADGFGIKEGEVEQLLLTSARLMDDFPDDPEKVQESIYAPTLLTIVIEPLLEYYQKLLDSDSCNSEKAISRMDNSELDLHLKGTLEGAALCLVCYNTGKKQLDKASKDRALYFGSDLSRYNRRLLVARYGQSGEEAAFAFKSLADVSGHLMYAIAKSLKKPDVAKQAIRIFDMYGNVHAAAACRKLLAEWDIGPSKKVQ